MNDTNFTLCLGGVDEDFDMLSHLDRRLFGCAVKRLDWDDLEA